MFGKEAFKLINELQMSTDIKPFNEFVVQQVFTEINTLYTLNREDIEQAQRTGASFNHDVVTFRHNAIERNKRCVLAYLYHRMNRLRDIRWQIGPILPNEISANLLPPEVKWLQSYNKALAGFMKSTGENGFNITKDVMPPKSLYIEVRCLVDYGRYEFENGQVINFKKNTHHLLPRDECEALIRQGILEHINS